MECESVRERLPWLLNRSLDAQESADIRSHLAGCPGCRAELDETRQVAGLFGVHLSSKALVDLAWERPPAGVSREAAHRHLEGCSSCSEELALLRESRRLEVEDPGPAKVASQGLRRAGLRYLAMAASLAVSFAIGAQWANGPRQQDRLGAQQESRRLVARLTEAEAEAGRLRAVEGDLRARLDRWKAPMANLPVVEVLAGSPAHRSAGASGNLIAVPRQAAFVVLVLNAERKHRSPAAVELRDGTGKAVWHVQGLLPSPLGGYTLGIPAERLPEGRASLVLVDEGVGGGPAESFEIRVRRQP